MAWFRRKRDDAPDVDEPTPARADDGDVVRATRSQAGDWMAMPPIHTTVGPPPSTFKVQRVSEIMTTRRPMAFMGQLGHQVSSSAPSGHVEGLTTTVAPPTAAPHPIDLPLHGRAPHHEEAPEEPAGAAGPTGPAAEPPVQRSVQDLAPDEPVTAQTLGIARPAAPVVQRELAASPAPSVPPAPSKARLPEPAPTRVLREPTRPPSPLEARAPSIPVVGEPAPPALAEPASTARFIEPDAPVEFVVRAGDPQPAPPVAPLAGDAPLQTGAAGDGSGVPAETATAPDVDLPLAAPPPPPAGEMMPPIQPRAIQRQATEAATHIRAASSERGGDSGLPPLPSWARTADAAADEDPTPTTPTAAAMPLHAPAPTPTVQREADSSPEEAEEHFEGDGHDHGGGDAPIQREADDTGISDDAVDAPVVAPLVGEAPLGTASVAVDGEHNEEDETSAAVDMPLQAPTASDGPGAAVQRETVGTLPTAADARASDSDEQAPADRDDEAPVAPLLGDRPLQLQRVDALAPSHPTAATAPANTLPLPLVADVAGGPTLADSPSPAPDRSAPPASGGAAMSARPPGAAPLQRTLAAGPAPSTPSVQRSAGHPGPTAAQAPAPPGSSLPLRTLAASPSSPAAGTPASSAPDPTTPTTPTTLPTLPSFAATAWAPAPAGSSPAAPPAAPGSSTTVLAAPVAARNGAVAVQTQRAPDGPVRMPLQEPARTSAADPTQAFLGDQAVAAGLARRADDGSVVFSAGAAAASGVSVPIQREVDGDAPGQLVPGETSFVVQREWQSARPSGPRKETSDEDKELDEMAAKLYDRIRRKLAAELRADQRRLGAASWKGR